MRKNYKKTNKNKKHSFKHNDSQKKVEQPQERTRYESPKTAPQVTIDGRVDIHPDGFGFLIAKDPLLPNVYITEESLRYVMHRDTVRARVETDSRMGKSRGSVIEILSRHQKEFLGILRIHGGGSLVVPMEARDRKHAFKVNTINPNLGALKSGVTVLAKIIKYPDVSQGSVDIESILEDPKAASNDTLKVLLMASWPREFSHKAIEDAENRAKTWKDKTLARRRDLTKLDLVTIDGRDARDFDDAVSAKVEGKNIRLWVAIADVSFFVSPGSPLDKEAFERSTSVYFPDHVVPMLPEVLSNGVCSLNPNEDRACLVCEMLINNMGAITSFEVYEGLMNSKKRLTYEQMQAFIEKERWAVEEMAPLEASLNATIGAFKRLNSAKVARGAIDLDIPEAVVMLNKDATVRDIQSRPRLDAHRLIEECMLAANECTAKFIQKHYPTAGMYRVHEEPDNKKIQDLLHFIELSGVHLYQQKRSQKRGETEASPLSHPRDFANLVDKLKTELEPGDPTARAIQTLILRSLKQARYSSARLGHFALAAEDYTHFTSPIRRYPDLIVHRLIKQALKIESGISTSEADLEAQARHCSDQERAAMDCERKLVDIKKCRYMETKLGEEFDAFVGGITEKGIFVQIDGHFVEGLVSSDTLGTRVKHHYDADRMAYVGPGNSLIRLGSRMRVLLAAVDIETRKIDFDLVKLYQKK